MPIEIADAANVRKKLRTLGCDQPRGLAVLPVNLDTARSVEELVLGGEAATIAQVLRAAKLPLTDVLPGRRLPFRLRRSFDWDGGILFVGMFETIANIVSSFEAIRVHLRDQFPNSSRKPVVRLEVRIETTETGSCKSIRFCGSEEALEELHRVIQEIRDAH